MAKGRLIKKSVVTSRKKDEFYFIAANGDLRAAKRNTKGGINGRKVCKPAAKKRATKRKRSK